MPELSHFDDQGHAHMVDVGAKAITTRVAVASGQIQMRPETMNSIVTGDSSKGNVLEVARLAGIMGSKRTADLIPLCHPLMLDSVELQLKPIDATRLQVTARVAASERTGVEMEALTAVSVACLTVYDMCKSIDREMAIGPIQLEEKRGGKSGHFRRKHQPDDNAK